MMPTRCSLYVQAIMQAAQLKADGKAQRVIVTGCLAQRYSQDLAGDTLCMYNRMHNFFQR